MGKFKKETESILITAQNNAIRTNYIKIKIEHTQQDNKCRFCGDRDETNNHIRSECCKLVQKEYLTEWGRLSTENCARNGNLTVLPNGICTNRNLS